MKIALITRPASQATATAKQLEQLGVQPCILPLVEILPFKVTLPEMSFDGLIATSANAFKSPYLKLEGLVNLPLFCVGEKTADAARAAGFEHIAATAFDVNALVALFSSIKLKQFLYLAGRGRQSILEAALKRQSKSIKVCETYQQRPRFPHASELANLPPYFDYALFYSAQPARLCYCLDRFFDKTTRFLCLSPRIVKALPGHYQPQARFTERADEAHLLNLLRS